MSGASVVERVDLPNGPTVSRVITGLWQIADMERDGQLPDLRERARAMLPYAEAGITTFDMADHYGSAELIAGEFSAMSPVGARAELLTKWVPEPGPLTRERVRAAIERSLARLRRDTLDLLQFHTWSYADPAWLDALFWLQELKDEGLIRGLGLTNFDTAHLRVALSSGIEISTNQVSYSLLDQRAGGSLAELCAEKNVRILAYGTLAGGFLTEKWLGEADPGLDDSLTWSLLKYRRFIEVVGGWEAYQGLLEVLARVASVHGVSVANVASRYILDSPGVASVIVGARLGQSEHLTDTLGLFDLQLSASDKQQVGDALRALTPLPGDTGDEYRKPPYLTASGDLSHHLSEFPAPYPTRQNATDRLVVSSGTGSEQVAGYSRAVRVGDRVLVSGTTASHGDILIGGNDPEAQTHHILDKVEGALLSVGGRLADVVRTRVYLNNVDDWEAVSRAHKVRLGTVAPANTMVQANLIGDGYLVEIEVEAEL